MVKYMYRYRWMGRRRSDSETKKLRTGLRAWACGPSRAGAALRQLSHRSRKPSRVLCGVSYK
eukprot:2712503-Prymnesium_polylepis.1